MQKDKNRICRSEPVPPALNSDFLSCPLSALCAALDSDENGTVSTAQLGNLLGSNADTVFTPSELEDMFSHASLENERISLADIRAAVTLALTGTAPTMVQNQKKKKQKQNNKSNKKQKTNQTKKQRKPTPEQL